MDDWGIEGIAVRAGVEDAVSGVGEEVDEGVGGNINVGILQDEFYCPYSRLVLVLS